MAQTGFLNFEWSVGLLLDPRPKRCAKTVRVKFEILPLHKSGHRSVGDCLSSIAGNKLSPSWTALQCLTIDAVSDESGIRRAFPVFVRSAGKFQISPSLSEKPTSLTSPVRATAFLCQIGASSSFSTCWSISSTGYRPSEGSTGPSSARLRHPPSIQLCALRSSSLFDASSSTTSRHCPPRHRATRRGIPRFDRAKERAENCVTLRWIEGGRPLLSGRCDAENIEGAHRGVPLKVTKGTAEQGESVIFVTLRGSSRESCAPGA